MNLTELFDGTVDSYPQKPALIEGETTVSYAGLADKVAALSSRLASLQMPRGCRVGLCYPNSIAYVALTLALWRLNAIVVPIPTECTEEEIASIATSMRLDAILD